MNAIISSWDGHVPYQSDSWSRATSWHHRNYGSTIFCIAIVYAESAGKHGIAEEDAVHAILNYRWGVKDFTTLDYPEPADLYIGPTPRGQLLEVLLHPVHPRGLAIFQVMPLRKKIHQRVLELID